MANPALQIFQDENPELELVSDAPEAELVTAKSSDLEKVNLHFLLADINTPCDIFLYRKELFVRVCTAGEKINVADLERWKSEHFDIGFIKKDQYQEWIHWQKKRHIQRKEIKLANANDRASRKNQKGGSDSTLANFLSYAFETIRFETNSSDEEEELNKARIILRDTLKSPCISWYFDKKRDDAAFYHCARVTYLSELFVTFALPPMPSQAHEALVLSSAIHELDTDPTKFAGKLVSAETIAKISTKNVAIQQRIIDIISQHDELFNGRGGPRGLKGKEISILARIFQYANAYDHCYLKFAGGTRRSRMERTVKLIHERKDEFDPKLWNPFFIFIQKIEIY